MTWGLSIEDMLGDTARRASAWFYTRRHGGGVVSFIGAAKVGDSDDASAQHPFTYGTKGRDVEFCNGEVILRPAVVVATDVFKGFTLGQLCDGHNIDHMLSDGEVIIDKLNSTQGLRSTY